MYLVMKLCAWEDMKFEVNLPYPIEVKSPKGQIGYCIVFDDYDEALEFAGNPDLVRQIGLKED